MSKRRRLALNWLLICELSKQVRVSRKSLASCYGRLCCKLSLYPSYLLRRDHWLTQFSVNCWRKKFAVNDRRVINLSSFYCEVSQAKVTSVRLPKGSIFLKTTKLEQGSKRLVNMTLVILHVRFLDCLFKKKCFSSSPHRSCALHMFDFSNLESILVFLLLWLLWLAGVNCV